MPHSPARRTPLHTGLALGLALLWAGAAAAQGMPPSRPQAPTSPQKEPGPTIHRRVVDNARAVSMGGAVRADPVAGSALHYNPAGMAQAALYSAEVQYSRDQPTETNAFALSIVDSKTQPAIAVGLSYGYQFTGDGAPGENDGHDLRLAFAHPLIPQQLALGVGMHYLSLSRGGTQDLNAFTLDLGLLWAITPAFHLGLVAESLVPTDDVAYPRRVGGGVAYVSGIATVDVDLLADIDSGEGTNLAVMGGLELLLGGNLPLRMGVEYNGAREATALSGGLGALLGGAEGGLQLNISYRHSLSFSEEYQLIGSIALFI